MEGIPHRREWGCGTAKKKCSPGGPMLRALPGLRSPPGNVLTRISCDCFVGRVFTGHA
jgi:hypothetical protein